MTKPIPTVFVIFTDPKSFPKNPAYEGEDVVQAATTLLKAADVGKATSIRIRWRGKLIYGLPTDVQPLVQEIKRQRNAQPKEANQHGWKH